MEEHKNANRLIREKSPYLLQHAHNPVDWYPWGEEAFARARNEMRPIFLSVGYSTCHWCHVMEQESFEDGSIAGLLNRYFVCIKVDREERPDVDRVYMNALQALGQNGGWPMSMFLTPDLRPFFGGTYFPPETRYGRMGFPDVLRRIHEIWEQERNRVIESAARLEEYLQEMVRAPTPSGVIGAHVLRTSFEGFRKSYDSTFGGFGNGPKFPRPVVFNFLLRYYARERDSEALEMVSRTLQKMSVGGIYDHLGGGFHRYAVDGEWRVPHFEKMLYDQAQLVNSYLDLYQISGDPFYASVAREVLDYVLHDMTGEEGGFYSAEDADSPRPENPGEQGEGAFYVWTKREVLDILGKDGEMLCHYYGIEETGNAPFDPQHEFTGRNILYVARTVEETARVFSRDQAAVCTSLALARSKLYSVRARRPRPQLDDKVLTGWNGLMIGALARASQVLKDARYAGAARAAASFVLQHLRDPATGILRRRYRDGEAKLEAHLDDYAFLTEGLLDLYEACLESRWLLKAIELTGKQIELFRDDTGGGFFDTSGKDPSILVRTKEQYDGAEPTGNAVAAMNLLRLAHITNNRDWRAEGERTIAGFGAMMEKQPVVMPQMLAALDYFLSTPLQIVIAGRRDDRATALLEREVHSRYLPNKIILFVDGEEEQEVIGRLLPFASGLKMIGGRATAYVCQNYTCSLPTTNPEILGEQLDGQNVVPSIISGK